MFVGRLEKRKGVKYLIEAFDQLSKTHKDVSLTIAGDGGLRPSLETLVKKLGTPNVEFLGFIDEKKKIKLLFGVCNEVLQMQLNSLLDYQLMV